MYHVDMDETIANIFTASSRWAKAVNETDPTFFERNSGLDQSPKVFWIGCADSRVPESVITAAKPGDIFVHRNIANQVLPDDDNMLSVLTHAIENLCVEHVVVVGHTACGGAAAAYEAALAAAACLAMPAPPADSPLERWLVPLTALASSLNLTTVSFEEGLSVVTEENVRRQVENLVRTAPVRAAWADGKKVWVHGWVYQLENGKLRDLDVSLGPKKA